MQAAANRRNTVISNQMGPPDQDAEPYVPDLSVQNYGVAKSGKQRKGPINYSNDDY